MGPLRNRKALKQGANKWKILHMTVIDTSYYTTDNRLLLFLALLMTFPIRTPIPR